MLLRFVLLLLLAAPAVAQPVEDIVRVPFNVSIWKGLSIGDAVAGDTSRQVLHHVSLALPYGWADHLDGVSVALGSAVYEGSVYGAQIAGLANVAGESATAIQVAGLANVVGERMAGGQVAGLANVIGEDGGILQVAGLANVAGEHYDGAQIAGLANITGDDFRGIQASGLASIAGEHAEGAQVAGLVSIAGESMRGVQAAGLANLIGEDLVGLQAAPFNVVGGAVRGVQIGVVNVASESEGLQVGIVNVAGEQRGMPVGLYSRTGGVPVRLDVWTDETAALHVGVRSGSAVVSNYVGVSARPFSDAPYRWGVFAGLGVEQPLGARTAWGLDALAHGLFAEDFGAVGGTLVRLRGIVTHEVGERLAVFGGPAFSLFLSGEHDGGGLAPYAIYEREAATNVRAWPGLEAGLRIRLTDA